jgi:predicted transcriptional regulator of viral defense system
MRPQGRTVEEILAALAGERHGVVARRGLLEAGISDGEIKRRMRSGALLVEFRGVYRVGHRAPSREARYAAAVEACGSGALLRGRSAAHLHGLLRGPAPPPEVATPTERRIEGITTCRCRRLDPRDATVVDGIPVTTVARTLVDLAAVLGVEALARACHEAGVLHGTTPEEVEAVLARRPGSPGARKLRSVLRGEVRVTLSTLERRFLVRLKSAGLPLPETKRVAGGRRVPPLHLRRRPRRPALHARRALGPVRVAPSCLRVAMRPQGRTAASFRRPSRAPSAGR